MFLAVRLIIKLVTLALTLWLLGSVALFGIMWLPPGQFASVVGQVPSTVVTRVLPFRTLWGFARQGSLRPGDQAPDFDLDRHDKSGRVRLTSHVGSKPVVLVFGSYT